MSPREYNMVVTFMIQSAKVDWCSAIALPQVAVFHDAFDHAGELFFSQGASECGVEMRYVKIAVKRAFFGEYPFISNA